jgi:hypothetical protein
MFLVALSILLSTAPSAPLQQACRGRVATGERPGSAGAVGCNIETGRLSTSGWAGRWVAAGASSAKRQRAIRCLICTVAAANDLATHAGAAPLTRPLPLNSELGLRSILPRALCRNVRTITSPVPEARHVRRGPYTYAYAYTYGRYRYSFTRHAVRPGLVQRPRQHRRGNGTVVGASQRARPERHTPALPWPLYLSVLVPTYRTCVPYYLTLPYLTPAPTTIPCLTRQYLT